jgi:hypothetical protein
VLNRLFRSQHNRIRLHTAGFEAFSTDIVRLCYDAFVRTTIDLTDEAYYIAKTVARETGQSLGATVSKFITESTASIPPAHAKRGELPLFRCVRRVTSADVRALEDEE